MWFLSYLLCCFIICGFVLWFIFSGCFRVYNIYFYLISLPSSLNSFCIVWGPWNNMQMFNFTPQGLCAIFGINFTCTYITIPYNTLLLFLLETASYLKNILIIEKHFLFPFIFTIFCCFSSSCVDSSLV